jgi:hypothetical protein
VNAAIELHDSECLIVETDNEGRGFVLLDAYVHRSDGEPGVASGEGGIQRIRFRFDGMSVDGEVGDLPAYIYEGSLVLDKSVQENMVQFPMTTSEAVRLSMMLAEDARVIIVSGIGLSIESEGKFRFVEPFAVS